MLPVTPPSFQIGHGVRIETVNIHQLGDVDVAGRPTLETMRIECMFPATGYAFSRGAADPYEYVRTLEGWCRSAKVLRFVVPDTAVNQPCRLERFAYGERDGTGDVYATLTLRQHKAVGEPSGKDSPSPALQEQSYRVGEGDTLSSICRQKYGDAALSRLVAQYNGLKNPHLIFAGDMLRLPDREGLGG